jgi:hypothetical protein
MKRSVIILVALFVLAATSFSVVKNNRQPKNKTGFCCKKTGAEKQEKKLPAALPYLPSVNFF